MQNERSMFTYFAGWQTFDKVVGKDTDATFQLALPPASINDVLIEHGDDVSFDQRQLVVIRRSVRIANDRPNLGCRPTSMHVTLRRHHTATE